MKIKSIKKTQYKGKVYNFGTPPNHNYWANGMLVHNCYQSSTAQGKHAAWEDVNATLEALAELGVMEIAFGGGETTKYPHLVQALARCHELGMVSNFTTYGVDWLKNKDLLEAVRKYVGAVGVSVHTLKDLSKPQKIQDALNQNRLWGDPWIRVVAQHVVGTLDVADTAALLEQSWLQGIPMLLLGYKTVGFGAAQAPHDLYGLDTILRLQSDRVSKPHYNARFYTLGVDTSFVEQFGSLLEEIDVPQVLITNTEGAFSMYVDCVTMQQGPSSYMPDRMETILKSNMAESIRTAFEKW